MGLDSKPETESRDVKHQFLETGFNSYLQAMVAMAKFRREVYETCKHVLDNRCLELEQAIGMPVDATAIKPHAWQERVADQLEWDGSWTVLGAKVPLTGGGTFFCYLWWNYEEADTPVIRAVASIVPKRASVIDRFIGPLKKASPSKIWNEGGEVWLGEVVPPVEFLDFERKLDDLMSQWIHMLQKIGGIKLE
jgi:hypothetical protein